MKNYQKMKPMKLANLATIVNLVNLVNLANHVDLDLLIPFGFICNCAQFHCVLAMLSE